MGEPTPKKDSTRGSRRKLVGRVDEARLHKIIEEIRA